ncbi:MAG: Ca-activated chloride channel [Gaiellaceae bacterium]|nr:Ca-activated chloride channel [Gaiellaceae bacterium]
MSFAAPLLLVFLVAVPAAVGGYVWLERRRDARAAGWAAPSLLPNLVERPPGWRRHLPTALLLAGVALLLVGFARPRTSVSVKRQEATVVVVLDVSGSMAAKDAQPTRLGAARAAALQFVDKLPKGYRMALVTFSDHAAVVVPATHDLTAMRAGIARAKSGPQGTALAEAVSRAVDVGLSVKGQAQGQRRPPAIVVLFSDGGQTAGRLTPAQAAAKAKKAGIPVSTVSVGTADGVVLQPLKGGFTERIQVPAQPASLQAIARGSLGRYHSSLATVDVKAIYRDLGSRVGNQNKTVEVTAVAAGGGLVLMLAGAVLSGVWFRRFP